MVYSFISILNRDQNHPSIRSNERTEMETKLFLLLLSILPFVHSLELSVREGYNVDITCGPGEVIEVESAVWKFDKSKILNGIVPNWRNFCPACLHLGITCSYNRAAEVRSLCEGENECHFIGNRTIFGNDCSYWMSVDINYNCHSCEQRHRHRRTEFGFNYDHLCVREGMRINLRAAHGERNDPACPRSEFILKHVMAYGYPNTKKGAENCAKSVAWLRTRAQTSTTHVQTLFYAPLMSYHYHVDPRDSMEVCVFYRTATKWQCHAVPNSDEWNCSYESEHIAAHNKNNGHYHPEKDDYPVDGWHDYQP